MNFKKGESIYFLEINYDKNLEKQCAKAFITLHKFKIINDVGDVKDTVGNIYIKINKKFKELVSYVDQSKIYDVCKRSLPHFKTIEECNEKVNIYYKADSKNYCILTHLSINYSELCVMNIPCEILDKYLVE
jgi:hypothetical protein